MNKDGRGTAERLTQQGEEELVTVELAQGCPDPELKGNCPASHAGFTLEDFSAFYSTWN